MLGYGVGVWGVGRGRGGCVGKQEDEWDGETGLITEVLDRNLEAGQTQMQAYLCGPPPMIDAAIPVLVSKGISEDRIFFDKFTNTGKVE